MRRAQDTLGSRRVEQIFDREIFDTRDNDDDSGLTGAESATAFILGALGHHEALVGFENRQHFATSLDPLNVDDDSL